MHTVCILITLTILFPNASSQVCLRFINVIILYLETSTEFKYMFHFIYIHICKLKEILVQKTRKTIFSF